jgi:hypothetical protein
MPKEWILNTAINRWGLQKYKNVYPKEHLIEIVVLRRIENKPIIFVQIILPLNL